jgi:hypothetical protein
MTKIVGLIFVVTVLAQAQAGLTGRWRTTGTSKGGIGAMFELHDDGTLNFSPGAVVEMKYRIEGDQLILPPGTIDGPELHQKMEWVNADRLVLDGVQTLSRQGPVPDVNNPIVGEWTAPYEMGGIKSHVRYLYGPGGKGLLLFPFAWKKGSYSVKGAAIRIDLPESAPIEGPFRVDGDVLTIPGPHGSGESRLRRY